MPKPSCTLGRQKRSQRLYSAASAARGDLPSQRDRAAEPFLAPDAAEFLALGPVSHDAHFEVRAAGRRSRAAARSSTSTRLRR